jgi:polysaccharide export outer membrane protein
MKLAVLFLPLAALIGCSSAGTRPSDACAQPTSASPEYIIGPGDELDVFVWRNPDLSTSIPVRPDGRISMPLVEDMVAVDKTPTQLARDIETILAEFIREPTVNIIVRSTGGATQIQVVGSVLTPQAVVYREGLTVLDAVVAAGGLSDFAAGNRAAIVRTVDGQPLECRVRLDDLINDGDITQNIRLRPGDVVLVPEANF